MDVRLLKPEYMYKWRRRKKNVSEPKTLHWNYDIFLENWRFFLASSKLPFQINGINALRSLFEMKIREMQAKRQLNQRTP